MTPPGQVWGQTGFSQFDNSRDWSQEPLPLAGSSNGWHNRASQVHHLPNQDGGFSTNLASAVAAAAEQAKRIAAEAKASAAAKVAASAGSTAPSPGGSLLTPQSPPGAQMYLGAVPTGISEGLVLMEC